MPATISIIICTYKREALLRSCLESLNKVDLSGTEVIVVNNDADNKLQMVAREFPDARFVQEPNLGLSYARNKGTSESTGEWLFYMDDDALIQHNTISEIHKTLEGFDFQFFTGVWKAWYKTPQPKWLPYSTGNYIVKGDQTIRAIGDDYVSGGVMIIKKSLLDKVGGFPTHLGMAGNKVAYGEESYVEQKVKDLGYTVGINPNIAIDHLVGKHKYKLQWHLDAAYAKGRDGQLITPKSFLSRVWSLITTTLFSWVKPLVKLVIRKGFYWQNFIIDYAGNINFALGYLRSSRRD